MSHAVGWIFAVGWQLTGAAASVIVARDAWRRGRQVKSALFIAVAFWIVLCFWWIEVIR